MVKLEKKDCWYYIINAATLCFILTAYIIASIHFYDICNGNMMSLGVWLLVFALIETLYLVGLIIFDCCVHMENKKKIKLIGIYINCLFLLIWGIVGVIDLFGYSSACFAGQFSLWSGTLAVIIYIVIYIIATMIIMEHKILCEQ